MKIIKISIILLGLISVSYANCSDFLNSSSKIRIEERNLGPINPGSADNY